MPFPTRNRTSAAKEFTPEELLSRLQNFCAYRERCPKEVRAKLDELGASAPMAQSVMAALETEGFLNEHRFALAFAGGKFRHNQWGKVRIRRELAMRGIPPALISEALLEIEPDDYEALVLKLLRQKLAAKSGAPQAREKAAASVIRSGFEAELVLKILAKIER